jgi:hypothetical protein
MLRSYRRSRNHSDQNREMLPSRRFFRRRGRRAPRREWRRRSNAPTGSSLDRGSGGTIQLMNIGTMGSAISGAMKCKGTSALGSIWKSIDDVKSKPSFVTERKMWRAASVSIATSYQGIPGVWSFGPRYAQRYQSRKSASYRLMTKSCGPKSSARSLASMWATLSRPPMMRRSPFFRIACR